MKKKPREIEAAVDYIRANEYELSLKYAGLFLVFRGDRVLAKFKKAFQASSFIRANGLDDVLVWNFDPLPVETGLRLMVDQEAEKKRREKALSRLRQKRHYHKNKAKINARRAKKRALNPEKNREAVRAWYYKDKAKVLAKKKAQKMRRGCGKKS